MMPPPTLDDVLAARHRIAAHIRPTPLMRHPLLDAESGLELWVKHENHNPTCAFKVRGGLNLIASLTPVERARGVMTASTGNHGQSIAMACGIHGVSCTVFVPEGNNPDKNAAIRAYGATLAEGGRDFDDAREQCERRASETGARYVHSANEPLLLAGVATYALEIFEALPDPGTIFVPIGGGSGAAGACIAGKAMSSTLEVIGVGSEAAPAAYRSWRAGRAVEDRTATFAEGLATRTTFELPQRILRNGLDDFVLVSDDAIREAIVLLLERARTLAEAAGAAPLAAALALRKRLRGKRVALVCSGGNITLAQLREVLSASPAQPARL